MKLIKSIQREKGIAMAWALVVMLVLAIGAAAFLRFTSSDLYLTRVDAESTRAFYAAQAGLEKALLELKILYAKDIGHSMENLAKIKAPHMEGFVFENLSVLPAEAEKQGLLENGTFKGLKGVTRSIEISANVASKDYPNLKVSLRQQVEAQLIPIFQFAIFYNNDLEIQPGPEMTVIGPVHSNKNIYLGAGKSLDFDATVTSAGNIYHSRKDGSASGGGAVRIKDSTGNYQEMNNGDGTWLDSEHDDWVSESQNRWDSQVKSSPHQVGSLRLPIPNSDEPRAVIERPSPGDPEDLAKAKYHNRAGLKIVDGSVTNNSGLMVNLDYTDPNDPSKTLNPVSKKQIYNHREGTTISITEIDVAKLVESGKFPENGILYVSDQRNDMIQEIEQDAVRLVNGSELPERGLTVVTDRALYIQGDYNTINKKPASVLCDAINILSNTWDDANSSKTLSDRKAKATQINAAVIAGNTETELKQYNGGVENFPRFLEDWSGVPLTYSGSLVAMWESQIATGKWFYGDPYYTAPIRNWSYDTDLADPAKAPPGSPSVTTIEEVCWKYE